MKLFYGWLLLTCLASCQEQPAPPSSRMPITNDSAFLKNEPVNPYMAVDISPMDMSYLPNDYPKVADPNHPPVARVIYSRPHKQGRRIFGSLLKYGEPWRLGANEATEIEFFRPVTIQHKAIPKGKYVIYCIPQADHWTIVLNSNINSWGLTPDPSRDLYKFDIPVQQKDMSIEYFSMVFQNAPAGADLVMAWDNVEARLPIQLHP